MTKREYFESQGFHTFNPTFVADEEADEAFIEFVDGLKEIFAEELGQKHDREM